MFHKLTTITLGLNYGEPAGEALKGKPVPLNKAMETIHASMQAHHIDCYTVIEAVGYWQGNPERSLKIEVNHNDSSGQLVKVAAQLKAILMQESVLFTEVSAQADLI